MEEILEDFEVTRDSHKILTRFLVYLVDLKDILGAASSLGLQSLTVMFFVNGNIIPGDKNNIYSNYGELWNNQDMPGAKGGPLDNADMQMRNSWPSSRAFPYYHRMPILSIVGRQVGISRRTRLLWLESPNFVQKLCGSCTL